MIGETIAHYRITSKLGEGGMGAVFRAEDTKLGRAVALKFLPAELTADPTARKRLLTEAQVASRLHHPNIATIFEVGDEEGTPFIAMELVEGESLKDMIARGPMPPNKLLDIARQIADGLQEAHAAGVLHRDLKPANIMVNAKGQAKILDFGLAVITGRERAPGETQDAFLTRSRTQWSTGGTVPYMPPEQLQGETTDVRGDVFSFGVLLYECLSGRYPFPGETAIEMMHAIVTKPPVPLHEVAPAISPSWEQGILRALAKDPDQRFQSVAEMRQSFRAADRPEKQAKKSVAVLFFENQSRNEEDEYFRDGITEDIITDLSNIKELKIFPRTTMLQYRDKPVTASMIAQQLDARYVLEGTVRRGGNRLRITAQLVETRTGSSIWAERFDREMEDVFAIQDEIAESIAKTLRVMLTEQEKRAIEKKPTEDVQAYDYYLQGRQYFHRFSRKGFDTARNMFARAIMIDPKFARAYASAADCSSLLYMYWDANESNVKEADVASRKALELDPELAEAHVARGHALSLSRRFDEAEREFERAIELDPNLYEAYYFYAHACLPRGMIDKAIELFEKACAVRPEDYQAAQMLSSIYAGAGETDKSDSANRRAIEAAEKHLAVHGDDARALYLGAISLCALGKTERGLDWAQRALEIDPNELLTQYNVACVYARLGRLDEAVDCLERAVRGGSSECHVDWIEHDADLDPLRNHPRFKTLLETLR